MGIKGAPHFAFLTVLKQGLQKRPCSLGTQGFPLSDSPHLQHTKHAVCQCRDSRVICVISAISRFHKKSSRIANLTTLPRERIDALVARRAPVGNVLGVALEAQWPCMSYNGGRGGLEGGGKEGGETEGSMERVSTLTEMCEGRPNGHSDQWQRAGSREHKDPYSLFQGMKRWESVSWTSHMWQQKWRTCHERPSSMMCVAVWIVSSHAQHLT